MKLEFEKLSLGDMFFIEENYKNTECLKIDKDKRYGTNAVSLDGIRRLTFPNSQIVNVIRYRQHALNLRQGDIVQMAEHIGFTFATSLVLKVTEDDQYRKIKFARPMINGSGFGTTCPTASTYVETYEGQVALGNYASDNYYYVMGVDTFALHESCSFMLTADHFRMAVFLRACEYNREMAEILCEDYCQTRERVAKIIYDKIQNRKDINFPDRDDSAETTYEANLRYRQEHIDDLSVDEIKYLRLCDARRHPL